MTRQTESEARAVLAHKRAGSSQAAFTGVFYRSCSCGQEFKGDSETTFIERDQHIEFMNTSPRVVGNVIRGTDGTSLIVVDRHES